MLNDISHHIHFHAQCMQVFFRLMVANEDLFIYKYNKMQ